MSHDRLRAPLETDSETGPAFFLQARRAERLTPKTLGNYR
jgi:hypothetical protein